jgi:hypothetical protein
MVGTNKMQIVFQMKNKLSPARVCSNLKVLCKEKLTVGVGYFNCWSIDLIRGGLRTGKKRALHLSVKYGHLCTYQNYINVQFCYDLLKQFKDRASGGRSRNNCYKLKTELVKVKY